MFDESEGEIDQDVGLDLEDENEDNIIGNTSDSLDLLWSISAFVVEQLVGTVWDVFSRSSSRFRSLTLTNSFTFLPWSDVVKNLWLVITVIRK